MACELSALRLFLLGRVPAGMRWAGVGAVAAGMAQQGYDVRLKLRDARWHVYFTIDRKNFAPAAASGYASDPKSWRAIQWAAWQVMKRSP